VTSVRAHGAKIYGIDWAHNSSRELITCSLDKTVKVWDVNTVAISGSSDFMSRLPETSKFVPSSSVDEPRAVIHTDYPVWRARDLPFGKGVLSLPQRSANTLEMWRTALDDPEPESPVEIFPGHTDVVKEFVWRRGGRGIFTTFFTYADFAHVTLLKTGAIFSLSLGQKIGRYAFGPLKQRLWRYTILPANDVSRRG
jgi:WD40 repeat protein